MNKKIHLIKHGLAKLLVGAAILGFSSNSYSQQSEEAFWIRQAPTATKLGALCKELWAMDIDNNVRADVTREESEKAIRNVAEEEKEKANQEMQERAKRIEQEERLKKIEIIRQK